MVGVLVSTVLVLVSTVVVLVSTVEVLVSTVVVWVTTKVVPGLTVVVLVGTVKRAWVEAPPLPVGSGCVTVPPLLTGPPRPGLALSFPAPTHGHTGPGGAQARANARARAPARASKSAREHRLARKPRATHVCTCIYI